MEKDLEKGMNTGQEQEVKGAEKTTGKTPAFLKYDDIENARNDGNHLLLNELIVLRSQADGGFAKKDARVVKVNIRNQDGSTLKLAGIYLTASGMTDEKAEDIALEGKLTSENVMIVSRDSAAAKILS